MAQSSALATDSVESVKFSFYTTEEVRDLSKKKITEVQLFDDLDRPIPGGLYDPALGPVHDKAICTTCDQRSLQCIGHFGHIELIHPVYNPLLVNVLFNLLKISCFCCHHFMAEREQVEKCASKLELIMKGDIVGAESAGVALQSDLFSSHENGATLNDDSKHLKGQNWTSLQYSHAMSLLEEFMKRKSKKCMRCGFKSPTITHPTFGWIYMETSNSTIRRNVIRGSDLEKAFLDEAEQNSSIGGEQNANDMSARGTEVYSDDMQSSGAVYDGIPDSSPKAKKDRVGNLPREFLKQKQLHSGPLYPSKVKDLIQKLWDNETQLCSLICDIHREILCISAKKRSYFMFFIEALSVPPIKFRPLTMGGDSVTNHPQTILLSKVLQSNIDLRNARLHDPSKIPIRWRDLQQSVNVLFGNKKSIGQRDNMGHGICQLLEKKEGIFRQKMMGKRVNYSCRSVISPDPYLAVNEIGIPPCFALKLTYPERVTPWNADKLRNAVINGPDVHPGATHYIDQSGHTKLPPGRKRRISISRKLPSSRGVVTQLGKSTEHEHEGKVVYRHLQDGDIVLVNRQPTLHKPGIMAHVVRVLTGEKTLRMHYANCSTYNADFDGDEMNVHFPQDEISRAEAFHIVNANNQYIIPTSGDTKRGLIQDHIVAAVLLTKKDTFLSREDYTHLLYSSGISAAAQGSFVAKSCQKVSTLISEGEMNLVEPAILKPEPLWTGKQVITSLLNHMTKRKGLPTFTVKGKCTIANKFLTSQSSYDDDLPFLIHENDFLNGVIDKAQFGKYGLIHTVQELYGSNTAGILLSEFSRLFTVFLQLHGFTCGVDDLLLKGDIDIKRKKELQDADKIDKNVYSEVYSRFVNAEEEKEGKHMENFDVQSMSVDAKDNNIERMELQVAIEKKVRVHGDSAITLLDNSMTSAANKLTNTVNNIIFPNKAKDQLANKLEDKSEDIGLSKAFPRNCFLLMTISGAKGGQANFTQVSSLLGQQSLEGKRVPLMISGKTLPCFPPWDPALRAGGFITDCFLTGLRPQEYYFHCMAGREGLVDTAVKTSRSGYLQRCLVKNLECLKVGYDLTVRDADGSVVQFYYGEDGVDVHKTSFISNFETIARNWRVVRERLRGQWEDALIIRSDNCKELRDKLKKTGEDMHEKLENKSKVLEEILKRNAGKGKPSPPPLKKADVMNLMMLKYLKSLAQPGEPVGVIAAQSVGEPSTQMTLNTFHHAGQKDSNVTLGVPRLQEILMRASEKIQTPIMSCPLIIGKERKDAERLAGTLRKVSVADIVQSMEVSVLPCSIEKHQVSTIYKLKMKLYPHEKFPENSGIETLEACEETLKVLFVQELERAMQSHLTMLSKIAGIKNIVQRAESDLSEETNEADAGQISKQKGEENNGSDDDDDEGEDLGTDAEKRRQQSKDEMEYEDGMENKNIEGEPSGLESEIDQVEPEDENGSDGEAESLNVEDESRLGPVVTKPKSSSKKTRSEAKSKTTDALQNQKETDRAIFVDFHPEESSFEVHFRLTNEPHILLSQIAQKAAKNVYIKKLAKIDGCKVDKPKEGKPPRIRTSGVDFRALWDMQEDLEINRIKSNDVHAILQIYGVEAARTVIVKELSRVFKTYGISTDLRHLSLIADFMTQSGKYRPLNRHGMADSISPFSKMSFETASTFIVNAAIRGEVDNLESPSARICLGLPVKMGTGSFDLMQQVRV